MAGLIYAQMKCADMMRELYSHESSGWHLGLENIRTLLDKVGNPHLGMKYIHVAGTNGKGSVCAFLAKMIEIAGYKTGLYTSPHLIRFNERISINGRDISDRELVEMYKIVRPNIRKHTFFEITTAIAFLYFHKMRVDFVVLEVGLGGRLDATNVVKPQLSIITNISKEHVDYLGNTIEKIAYEKAGIIKENIPVITACNGRALNVIMKLAKSKNAPVFRAMPAIKSKSGIAIGSYRNLKFSLKGEFQYMNASVAVTAIEVLRKLDIIKISEENIRRALADTIWNGRFQFLRDNILSDCAHNPDGIRTLCKEIKRLKYDRLILVIGILRDKDIKEMLGIIEPLADKIILTKPPVSRAAESEELAEFLKKECILVNNISHAIDTAEKISSESDIIVITGSIYLVGEVIRIIKASHNGHKHLRRK